MGQAYTTIMEDLAPSSFGSTVLSRYPAALVDNIGNMLSCIGLIIWYLPCSSFSAVLARRRCSLGRLSMTKQLYEPLIKLCVDEIPYMRDREVCALPPTMLGHLLGSYS